MSSLQSRPPRPRHRKTNSEESSLLPHISATMSMLLNEQLDPSSTDSAADASHDEYTPNNYTNNKTSHRRRNGTYDQNVDNDDDGHYHAYDENEEIEPVDDDEVLLFKNALLGSSSTNHHHLTSSASAVLMPSSSSSSNTTAIIANGNPQRFSAASPTESSFALTSAPSSPGSMMLKTEDEIHLNDLMSLRDDSDE